MADVSLSYMIKICKDTMKDNISIEESTSDNIRKLLTEQGDILSLLDVDDILVHPNVTGMTHRHTIGTEKLYPKDVRKVCVRDNDKPLKPDQYPPLVHHSVKARFDLVAEYRPPALRGIEFDLQLPNGKKKPISGISGLREHPDNRPRDEKMAG